MRGDFLGLDLKQKLVTVTDFGRRPRREPVDSEIGNCHQFFLLDVHDHVLGSVGLVVGSTTHVQRGPFDDHDGAGRGQPGDVDGGTVDHPARRAPGDAGVADGRQGTADDGMGLLDQ